MSLWYDKDYLCPQEGYQNCPLKFRNYQKLPAWTFIAKLLWSVAIVGFISVLTLQKTCIFWECTKIPSILLDGGIPLWVIKSEVYSGSTEKPVPLYYAVLILKDVCNFLVMAEACLGPLWVLLRIWRIFAWCKHRMKHVCLN
jgi:hypothetical protein